MKKIEIIEKSIDRFKTKFWGRVNLGRPPVGIAEADFFRLLQHGFRALLNNEHRRDN